MACPTCTGTMQGLPSAEGYKQYWCGRCGTIKTVESGGFESVARPLLVSDCRRVIRDRAEANDQGMLALMHREGVIECSLMPEQRPPVYADIRLGATDPT